LKLLQAKLQVWDSVIMKAFWD